MNTMNTKIINTDISAISRAFYATPSVALIERSLAVLENGGDGVAVFEINDGDGTNGCETTMRDFGRAIGNASCVEGHDVIVKNGMCHTTCGANVHDVNITFDANGMFLTADSDESECLWPCFEELGSKRVGGAKSAQRVAGLLMYVDRENSLDWTAINGGVFVPFVA